MALRNFTGSNDIVISPANSTIGTGIFHKLVAICALDSYGGNIWPVTLWAISPGHGLYMKDGTLVLPLWLSRGGERTFARLLRLSV